VRSVPQSRLNPIKGTQSERNKQNRRFTAIHIFLSMSVMEITNEMWDRAYYREIVRMEHEYQQRNLQIVTVAELPENDQSWIDTCAKWNPLHFGGSQRTCWLQFATSYEAFKFAAATYGKSFRSRTLTPTPTQLANPEDFNRLILDLWEISCRISV